VWVAVALTAIALAMRLPAMPVSTDRNMDADAAHFLNLAREVSRGHGFVNVGAWPAWMKPATLPMPETFKEPGYPYLIAWLTPLAHDPFRAGQLLSLIAGILLPLALYRLARNLGADRTTAFVAGVLCAGSPRLINQSVRVMVDSLFPLAITLAFAAAAWRPPDPGHAWRRDALTGALLGGALLLRGAALLAIPAVAMLLLSGRRGRRAWAGLGLAVLAGMLAASPFLLRNLRMFGTLFYSDVGAYGIWPYVDTLRFSHGLDRPPAPFGFALTHIPDLVQHSVWSARYFFVDVLPIELLGSALWCATAAFGLLLAPGRLRATGFAYLYVACTMAFIFMVYWDGRYFVSITPLLCLFAACGAVALADRLRGLELPFGPRSGPVLVGVLAASLAAQAIEGRHEAHRPGPLELQAARSEAAFLRDHLAPDESVMVLTTSYWSWFADRFSVHLVIADEARFLETVRRLKVRYAALPTSRLGIYAARFEGGRLPDCLEPLRSDPGTDITLFRVRDDAAADLPPGR